MDQNHHWTNMSPQVDFPMWYPPGSMDNHFFDNSASSSTHEPSLPGRQINNNLVFPSTTTQFSIDGGSGEHVCPFQLPVMDQIPHWTNVSPQVDLPVWYPLGSMDNHYSHNLAGSSTHEPSLPDQQIINQLAFSSTTAQFSTDGGGEISSQDMMHMEHDHLPFPRRYSYYRVEDVEELIKGVYQHGRRWEKILRESQHFQTAGRTAENLADKWRDMLKLANNPKDHELKELYVLAKVIDEIVRERN